MVIYDEVLKEVNEDKLMEYVKNISKKVRLSGSKEELESFYYVKNKLESFGLKTKLEFCDAYVSLPINATFILENESYECITHSMSSSTLATGINAEIVYIEEIDSVNNIDVKSKIVLTNGLATPNSVKWAEENKASGVIFINGSITHEMIVSSVWGNPTTESYKILPNIPVISITDEIGMEIIHKIKQENVVKVTIKTKVDTGWRKIPILTTQIDGVQDSDKFILFSGHIDSWHYGAMDNGTANATMIEVARILSMNKEKLKRSVRIAFWSGHSHARYAASTWYADTNWEELHENGVAHVNIDSVGAKGAVVLTESNAMAETKSIIRDSVMKISGQSFNGTRYGRAGDQSFWGTGLPSILMGLSEQLPANDTASNAFAKLFGGPNSGGYGWWWHTTEDTIDKVEPKFLRRDCLIYLDIIMRLATEKIISVDQKEAALEIREKINFYSSQSKGILDFSVTQVRINELIRLLELKQQLINNNTLKEVEVNVINDCIMKLSRVLVPLNYLEGDIFEHDLCYNPEVIPRLSKITRLIETERKTNEYFLLVNELRREINKINYDILKAVNIIKDTLNKLEVNY